LHRLRPLHGDCLTRPDPSEVGRRRARDLDSPAADSARISLSGIDPSSMQAAATKALQASAVQISARGHVRFVTSVRSSPITGMCASALRIGAVPGQPLG